MFIPRNTGPAELGDPIKTLVPYDGNDVKTAWTAAAAFPWIAIANMPRREHVRYVGFFLRATLAWLRVTNPALHAAVSNGAATKTIVPVVGVRTGLVADIGLPPRCSVSPMADYLFYDAKRHNMWVRRDSGDPTMSAWLEALRATPAVPQETLEVLLAWASLAPLVGCMSATAAYGVGATYTVPFVQRSISSHMMSAMRRDSYAAMQLALPLTWDSAMDAAISGYPEAAARSWATDPVMAVCAERRVLDNVTSIEHSRAKEKALMETFPRMRKASTSATPSVDTLWTQIRSAREELLTASTDDDNISLATALMENSEEGLLGPADSVSCIATAVPSRAHTPPPAMSERDAGAIRHAARFAQMMPNGAPSMLNGANGDESVVF